MASVFNFKCTEQTQNGSDLVLNITKASQPTQLQVVCKSGEIIVEGELGTILGVPTAPGAPWKDPAGPPIEGPPLTSVLTISMFLTVTLRPLKREGFPANISPGIAI